MNVKAICKQYGLNQNEFEEFLLRFGDDIDYSYTSVGYVITDSFVPTIVARYLDAKNGTNTEALSVIRVRTISILFTPIGSTVCSPISCLLAK